MSNKERILGTEEAWESRALGADPKYAKTVSKERSNQVDEALGLQMISIRLDKELIETFKMLGQFHGLGYQPLMRDALKRFAESEMKAIVSGLVESQKKQQPHKPSQVKVAPAKEKKVA